MMVKLDKPIYVTKPNLPSLNKLHQYLEQIWQNGILTNNGPFHQEFELKLAQYLGVQDINLFTNATLALVVGLQALRITGEVITTPFSFVATTHALRWNGITPVFCDIEENRLNIDPDKIEALITPKTTAIMPVHVYGHPCETKKIQKIADKYGLKVIYDAAHAMGVKLQNKNLLLEGDMSVLSFHATKLFTTFEGGAIIIKDKKLKERIDYLKNFGFADEVTVVAPGINGKMNELQSVMGLLSLEIVEEEIQKRKKVADHYRERLKNINGLKYINFQDKIRSNNAYFPVFIEEKNFGVSREEVYTELKKRNVFTRRYFYPLISNFPTYRTLSSASKDNLPTANRIADRVLCLPIYGDLKKAEIDFIIDIILELYKAKD